MIITVDSNVLLSVFAKDSLYKQAVTLLEKYSSHEFIISDCIYLELCVHFPDIKILSEALQTLEINLLEEHQRNYPDVVNAWKRYLTKRRFSCPSCGKIIVLECPHCTYQVTFRQRVLTDFLIAGFALSNSNGILTFDPTYYKNYFPQLKILK